MKHPKSGFLVVERIQWFTDRAPGGRARDRTPSVSLGHDEILEKYRGIDGFRWPVAEGIPPPVQEGLALLEEESRVRSYFEALPLSKKDLLFVVEESATPSSSRLPRGAHLLGFDLGLIGESDPSSLIFHEVIYGLEPELRSLSGLLNESLLFQSPHGISVFRRERAALLRNGRDLEDDEDHPLSYAIYSSSG